MNKLPMSRTDLDSHANVFVVRINAQIIINTGRKVEAISSMPDYESLNQVPLVDTTIRHNDEQTGDYLVLIARDVLSISATYYTIIPLFIMRQVGVYLRTNSKFQVELSSIEDYIF